MDALSVSRREFTLSAAAMLGAGLTAVGRQRDSGPSESARSVQRTYHVLGVPLRSGSLYPGNEDDAQAYRDAKLLARLQAAGCNVLDDGNLAIPSYLPHHFIPPIRSWPGPRIVWDIISDRLQPILGQSGHVPLLIGCDCSVVVGTTQALLRTVVPEHSGPQRANVWSKPSGRAEASNAAKRTSMPTHAMATIDPRWSSGEQMTFPNIGHPFIYSAGVDHPLAGE